MNQKETKSPRSDLSRIIQRDFPEFSGFENHLPADVAGTFLKYLSYCPSVPLLEYSSHLFSSYSSDAAETRIRNLLSALPDVEKLHSECDDESERSARVSIAVTVAQDMSEMCLGTLCNRDWGEGLTSRVRAASFIARSLPYYWAMLSRKERLHIYVTLLGAEGNVGGLIKLCEERKSLSPDLVKEYFRNSSAPLREGVL